MVTNDIKEILKDNLIGGKRAEELAVEWLEGRGYKDIKWHENKASNEYFDILASKDNEQWIIEVKSGKEPSIKIENIVKMIDRPKTNKIGLIFIPNENETPIFFELNKMSHAGLKAWKTRRKK